MNELPDYIKPTSMRERELECVIADLKAEVAECKAVMQQALDALRQCQYTTPPAQRRIVNEAITALREALK